jgi:Flp pilus assembly protein TadG
MRKFDLRFILHKIKIRNRRGQSLVEFALLAPVLIILFMGMFDFGWILHQQIQMDNAVRLGARRGAVGETNTNIIARMKADCDFGLLTNQITIDVRNSTGTSIGNSNDRTPNNQIFIKITRNDVPMITPLGNFIAGLHTINLHSEAEFRIE